MEVLAFAKLNLTLEVLGRRADGYHEVRTILQTVDLADRLVLRPAPGLQVQCDDAALQGEANLVWRAAVALAKSRGVTPRAHIFLEKRIPVSMGLGGGSSDAASALVALNQLWGLRLSPEELARVAASLGSDVPFFLWGGTALGESRGDEVKPLPSLSSLPVTLICPDSTIPDKTASLFSRLTSDHYGDGERTLRLAEILKAGEFVVDMLCNVFEGVAFQTFPGLSDLRGRVSLLTGNRVHLSGAGPALFCLPSSEDEYQRVSNALQPSGTRVYFVHTVTGGPVAAVHG